MNQMRKLICCILIIALLSALVPSAHGISTKTAGKLALVAVLSGVAFLTRCLVKSDIRTIEELHARLGEPDQVVEFERGFDRWRVEQYGNRKYFFRNNVLQKTAQN